MVLTAANFTVMVFNYNFMDISTGFIIYLNYY